MTNGSEPAPNASPYERLGITPDASFDEVQAARQHQLAAVATDPQACAKVEAAYDAVLMERLRERQQGKVSSAAVTASKREEVKPAAARVPSRPSLPQLPSLPQFSGANKLQAPSLSMPTIALAEGRERWFPLVADGLLLLLVLVTPPGSAEVVLALATGVTVINLRRRNGRFLAAVGWSFALLSVGLLLGGLLTMGLDPALPLGLPLALNQVQSLPALILLLLGALLIA
ncbi:CPP1-like family protein [Synechococcus sp. RedBA-s]|uniref:CPP1-like family protein n=1 Tax=Synechococcus sp. RedBA-s TaxID=2823741 RepID=UPI0020CBFC6C|nr:CPP1-like family protein [Synechococcus sp. RedBA-s]MCP9799876.1 CPP1-like family protein [Synechococcus sp. RedBA-s]